MSTEVVRPRAHARMHRAVATVNEARGDASTLHAAFLPSLGPVPAFDPTAARTIRYDSFEAMLKACQQPDPLSALKSQLASMKPTPLPVDESARLPDAIWKLIMGFAGTAMSSDVARLGATCRRLRALVLRMGSHTEGLSTVNIVPQLLQLSELANPGTFDSVVAFLSAAGRAPHVRHLALVESKYASTLPCQHTHFPAPCALPPALTLVARLPELTTLDLRGVVWDCRNGARLSLLLPDLYLVAPQLETLKIGREVMALWTPQWWERLPHLRALVIASRREQPLPLGGNTQEEPSPAEGGPSSSSPDSTARLEPPPLLELSSDFMTLLSAERRQWRIKLWCPLSAASAQQLLFPSTPHTSLVELTVNVSGPAAAVLLHACASSAPVTSSGETAESSGKKNRAKKSLTPEVEVPLLPALTTLTVANAHSLPPLAPQLCQRLGTSLAPCLRHFNVCNTVCVPAPEKKPKKKAVAAAAVDATSTAA